MTFASRSTHEDRTYVGALSVGEYFDEFSSEFPELFGLLDPERLEEDAAEKFTADLNKISWVFEGNDVGGRGPGWSQSTKNVDRSVGMTALVSMFSDSRGRLPGPSYKVLDVLGGAGAVAEFTASLGDTAPTIITADLSNHMISVCRQKHLPCVRQSAEKSLFRDGSLDGILIAYGAQLLEAGSRMAVFREAFRTLKPQGRLVVHAFEKGGTVADFFDKVVHPFSRTGHPHEHYTRSEIRALFENAGFSGVEITEMSDPIIMRGETAEIARDNVIRHIYNGYDLVKLGSEQEAKRAVAELIEATLGAITVSPQEDCFTAEIARTTLVAVGYR